MSNRITKFIKEHFVGMTLFAVITGVIASLLVNFIPLPNFLSNEHTVQGYLVVTESGEFEVNYGYRFESKPKLEFLNEYEQPLWGTIKVIEQSEIGFKYTTAQGYRVGAEIQWIATGIGVQN
ncbi:hypothetical protein R5M54_004683 [Vibrio alginolyticus]|nr:MULTISPECIES: hypothetical protein [Vibrio harveyi group]EGR1393894.1 hypothetical protein [Vibrio parahaemolyticus]EHR5764881.1 hypothetical protein [Vibrio parahaemolyticus]EHY0932691.1 hypothetical protein [Vibrio parahaemolyticus]EJY0899157.1 hypothetical protein [Vibrio parahaemolyticus]EKO5233648.1 hypothetical protein [Vibrio parahaemolyticus]